MAHTVTLHELAALLATAPPTFADSRSLQHRVDRKFLLTERHVESLLPRLQGTFSVLPAGANLWAHYESIYFDTTALALFHAHRRGRRPRFKVRIRRHLDRQLAFLEVKRKNAGGSTTKHRLQIPMTQSRLGGPEREFIAAHTPFAVPDLIPTMETTFVRLTLVANEQQERLTLDRTLSFSRDGRLRQVPGLVVGEVKQRAFANRSGSVASMRVSGAREVSFSKYCVGTVLLSDVPDHVFRPCLRAVDRLTP